MEEQMAARLEELKSEYKNGEAQLRVLVEQEAVLREALLRISGAVQVLEELAATHRSDTDGTGEQPTSDTRVLTVH